MFGSKEARDRALRDATSKYALLEVQERQERAAWKAKIVPTSHSWAMVEDSVLVEARLSARATVAAAVLSRGDLLDLAVTHQDEATHAAGALQYVDPILDPAAFQADLRLRHSRSAWISQMAFEKLGAKLLKAATSP